MNDYFKCAKNGSLKSNKKLLTVKPFAKLQK